MGSLCLKIFQNKRKCGDFVVTSTELTKTRDDSQVDDTTRDLQIKTQKKRKVRLRIDGYLLHCVLNELLLSAAYREKFMRAFTARPDATSISFVLVPVSLEIIDYGWNHRINYLVRERCELEHALSWLSTLGGAFSALGDYFSNLALVAGKISYHQLTLAVRMGDPNIAARCRLYYSLSLIQQRNFKAAKGIIRQEYAAAKSAVIFDARLVKMCLGIWAKLQYEHQLHVQGKHGVRVRECR